MQNIEMQQRSPTIKSCQWSNFCLTSQFPLIEKVSNNPGQTFSHVHFPKGKAQFCRKSNYLVLLLCSMVPTQLFSKCWHVFMNSTKESKTWEYVLSLEICITHTCHVYLVLKRCDESMMHDAFSKLLKQAPFFSPGTLGICNLIQPQSIRDPLQLSILRIPRGRAVGIYIDVIRKFLEHFNLFLKALAIPATRTFYKYKVLLRNDCCMF